MAPILVSGSPRAGVAKPVATGTLLVKDISYLATVSEQLGELRDAYILVKGNLIEAVGLTKDLTPEQEQSADKVVSLKGCVVVPGLVNTHSHHFQSLTRCIAQDKQLHGWLKTLYPIWAKYTSDDLYIATKLSLVELVLSGCTTTSDHCYVFPNDCALDDTVRAARDVGVRFHAVRGGMSAGISKGGIAPDSLVEEEDAILADAERCIQEMHDNERLAMLRVAVGPSSQKVVTDSLMIAAAQLARRYPGVRLHTHLAENQEDIVMMKKTHGFRFKQYIQSVGWDKSDCWFAHCCMLDDEEQALFAEAGIGIAHCPSSNTRLASGICPVRKMLDRGINVGVGVDGAASNDCQHLLMEARLAMLLQRAGGDPGALTAREALRMATKGGAKNLGREDEIGEVAPGFGADFVAWKMEGNLGFAGAGVDPVSALLLCAPSIGFVNFSCINGSVVVEEGKLVTADVGEVVDLANKASARVNAEVTKDGTGAGPYTRVTAKTNGSAAVVAADA